MKYDEKTVKQAVEMYQQFGPAVTAQTLGISKPTIIRWARVAKARPPSRATRKRASTNYTQAERMRMNNLLMERVELMLGDATNERALQSLVMSYAILTDKRRLEEGKGNNTASPEEMEALVKQSMGKVSQLRPPKKKAASG